MKNKDWGHALFLASKMDSRTHNNVMLRFANGLQNNDPLQTLYQLMSGHEPQAATVSSVLFTVNSNINLLLSRFSSQF